MAIKAKCALIGVLLVFFAAGCAASDTDAKLDYERLVGGWQWDYEKGYNLLTIEDVTVFGEKVVLTGYHEGYSVELGIDTLGKGKPVIGTIFPGREPKEIVFTFSAGNKSTIDVSWDGGGELVGTAQFKNWGGSVHYSKR